MILPNISEFIKNYVTKREISFFENDLINNKEKLTKEIKGKSILVIGGAGTIGSSYIKAALRYHPSELVVVDINENGLTELTRTLRSDFNIIVPESYLTYPMSFNSEVFYKMFDSHGKFDIVANFAAHKHVRSEKDSFSIEAMIKNNVLDAKKFLDYLKQNKPSHFFCVSTDKAANPVNVMGGSKKMMENVIMSYSKYLKITTARFANVAFSNGSLLYGYIERLLQRQPISCPSDVKRFFVSPEESGEICLLTCILGNSGDIYFPKLNENQLVNFKSITEDFFNYLNKDIQIYGTGKQTVDIIDVRDIAKVAIKSVRSGLGKSEDVLDVGSGRAISCNDLAKKIVRMTDSKSKIVHIPMRIGEALNTKIVAKSHTKLFKKLNYKLQFTLDDTIFI